jgi:hypothetical protein
MPIAIMLSVAKTPIMLSVIILNVAAPIFHQAFMISDNTSNTSSYFGATTLSIMTLSRQTFIITTLSITTLPLC